MIIKPQNAEFDYENDVLKSENYPPLWVKIPKLPMNCWSMDSLSRIGMQLGYHYMLMTVLADIISYARLLLEGDVTRSLSLTLRVQDLKERNFDQEVSYDWKVET